MNNNGLTSIVQNIPYLSQVDKGIRYLGFGKNKKY